MNHWIRASIAVPVLVSMLFGVTADAEESVAEKTSLGAPGLGLHSSTIMPATVDGIGPSRRHWVAS